MSKLIKNFPLFPISLIVLPGEVQPLHIFEPRYKQLINEMVESEEVFGIPFLNGDTICEFGSAVVIHRILAKSPTGEMDVLVKGVNLFRIKDIAEQLPGKLYGGGVIELLDEMNPGISSDLHSLFKTYQQQIAEINQHKDVVESEIFPNHLLDIAGQLPLDTQEKYEIVRASTNDEREALLLEKLNLLLMINKKLEEVGYRFYLN